MTELEPVFARLGILHYLQGFLQEGFDTWETVLDITESDLYGNPLDEPTWYAENV